MSRLLVIDTETGGLDPAVHSILSLGATVYPYAPGDPEFSVLVKETPFVVDAGALGVNKISLVEHHAGADDPAAAWFKFMDFVQTVSNLERLFGKFVLAGHNVPFDIGFLRRLHRLAGDTRPFDSLFSHRFEDTMTIGRFLARCGAPIKRFGLADLLEFFGLKNEAAHTALADARATAQLYGAMIESTSLNIRKKEVA